MLAHGFSPTRILPFRDRIYDSEYPYTAQRSKEVFTCLISFPLFFPFFSDEKIIYQIFSIFYTSCEAKYQTVKITVSYWTVRTILDAKHNKTNGKFNRLRKKCQYSELFCSVFSGIWTEYGEVLRISSYSVLMQENTYQNNSEYGLFRAVIVTGMTTKTQHFCLLTYEPISFRSYGKFGIITSLYQQLANLKTIF